MRKSIFMLVAACAALSTFAAGAPAAKPKTSTPAGFTDDYDAALARAAKESKPVFAVFSGSDWCGWCKRLEGEVLSKPEFRKAAEKLFVMLYVDSPRDKSLLSEKALQNNPGLVDKYGIEGFPTALLLDSKGEKIGQTGYRKGGPTSYLKHLKDLMKLAPYMKDYIEPLQKKLEAATGDFKHEFMAAKDKRAVVVKYLPQLEKALAEAKAFKVPDAIKADKDRLVQQAEQMLAAVRMFSGK